MTLSKLLLDLVTQGCFPSLYYRSDLWRGHVNAGGNYWADETTPLKAMRSAVRLWSKAGSPMDGMAANPPPKKEPN